MTNESAPAGGVPVDPPEPRLSEEEIATLHEWADDLDPAKCSGCTNGWSVDENFSCPEGLEPREWDGVRTPGEGLVPCGFCNHGGWDHDPGEPIAADPDDTFVLVRRALAEIASARAAAGGVVQPPADREVPEPGEETARVLLDGHVWLDGREYEVLPKEHARNGDRTLDARFLRPVGAAGGEGTDGD